MTPMKFASSAFILALLAALAAPAQETLDRATLDTWMKELSNWGRWGARTNWAPQTS